MAITCDMPGCRQPATRQLASLGPIGTKAQKDMHTLVVLELCPACTDRVGLGLGEYLGGLKDGSVPLPPLPEPEAGASESPDLGGLTATEAGDYQETVTYAQTSEPDAIGDPGPIDPPEERRGKRHRA